MLHLNFERADLACAKHSHQQAPSTHAAGGPQTHHHHAMPASDRGSATESEGCQTPVQPDCCQALITCSMTLAFNDASLGVVSPTSHEHAVEAVQSRPISRVTAPEPPPPKA